MQLVAAGRQFGPADDPAVVGRSGVDVDDRKHVGSLAGPDERHHIRQALWFGGAGRVASDSSRHELTVGEA